MTTEELLDLIVAQNYQAIENALQNGFDANRLLNNDTPGIQWASYTDDFRMMEIFWSYGAKPTTEYIQEIVAEFENGKTYLNFEETKDKPSDYHDLTYDFSVTKWTFLQGEFKAEEGSSYTIFLPISQFVLDGDIISTSVDLYAIELPEPLQNYMGKTMQFPVNPTEGYIDGSVYLRNAHNPVDVSEIRFLRLENDCVELELSMKFDFEYEDIGFKNEEIKCVVKLVKQDRM